MKLDVMAAIVAVILTFAAGAWYCFQIASGAVTPSLATWLIFGVATMISLWSYLKTPRKDELIANIGNKLDPIMTLVIIAFILLSPKSDKGLYAFDYACMAFSVVVLVLWAVSGSALLANILIQLIIVAGYFPTCYKMIHEGKNTESFVMWGANFVIALLFLGSQFRIRDRLGILYSARGAVSIAIILLIMLILYFRF